MKFNPFFAAAALALVLAMGLAGRIFSQKHGFQKVVNESLATTEGYDQQFINLVNHLEDVLTTRASFPYPGGKDPMTGRRREVAVAVLEPAARPAARAPARTASSKAASSKTAPAKDTAAPPPPEDKVRLTAIIADDYGQHTAIVMDGERSLSVDIGDMVGSRKVTRITGKEVTMEDDLTVFTYGLSGVRAQQRK